MSQPSYLSSFVYSAKVVGVLATGFMTGYCHSSSHGSVSGLLAAEAPPKYLPKMWLHVYERGAATAKPTALIGGSAFLFAAYQRYKYPALMRNTFGKYTGITESGQLLLAALFLLAAPVFTIVVMAPSVNNPLQAAARAVGPEHERDVRGHLATWLKLNSVRVCLFATSFVLGVLAL